MIKIRLIAILFLYVFVSTGYANPIKILFFYNEKTKDFVLQENINGVLDAFKKYHIISEDEYSSLSINKMYKAEIVEFAHVKLATNDNLKIVTQVELMEPDIIVTADETSLQMVASKYANTKYPIVFLGIEYYRFKNNNLASVVKEANNISGVVKGDVIDKSLALIKKLAPNIRNIAIIGDHSELSNNLAQEFTNVLLENHDYVLQDTVLSNDFNTLCRNLDKLIATKKIDALIILSLKDLSDGSKIVPYYKFLEWYEQNITLPEIALENIYVNRGTLCNVYFCNYKQGYYAGEKIAKMIMNYNFKLNNSVYYDENIKELVNVKRAKKLNITQIYTENRYYIE
jgi:ABC-type uncharacterized transport system substrate-binding protein